MTDWLAKRHRAAAGLYLPLGRRLFHRTACSATGTWLLLKVPRVLVRQLPLDLLREHPANLLAKVLDLSEGRRFRRPLIAKTASCHRSNAFIEFPLRLGRQGKLLLSVLAHRSFLSKCTKFSKPRLNIPHPAKIVNTNLKITQPQTSMFLHPSSLGGADAR